MEKGVIKVYDKGMGSGLIARRGELDVKFFADKILGRDRTNLKEGDTVMFEIENIENELRAINIRIKLM